MSKETADNVKIMTTNHGPLLKARGSVSGPSLNPLIMPPKRPDGFNSQSLSGMNSSPIGSQVSFILLSSYANIDPLFFSVDGTKITKLF